MKLHGRSGQSVAQRRGSSGGAVMLALALIPLSFALVLALRRAPDSSSHSGRPLGQTHSVTLYNDTELDGTFQWFVFGDYDNTITSIGPIAAGGSASVDVPINVDSSYVFYMDAQTSAGTGYLNSSVTEDRLDDLGYRFRFIQDDLSIAAVDPEDWPTPQFTPTPWDVTAEPTSTDEPAVP